MARALGMLLLAAALASSGCLQISRTGTPHPPAWIGAPARVLSPTSLEGAAWRERNCVLPGREYITTVPPGPTCQPQPPTKGQHNMWDPSHPLTTGP